MSFIVRAVQHDDLQQLHDLAKQFTLLNLPADKKVLGHKIEKSMQSFEAKLSKIESEYLFVLEDREEGSLVGSSLVMAKHGTDEVPHSYFKILKKESLQPRFGNWFYSSSSSVSVGYRWTNRNWRTSR
jgi:arginine N-succinyltransferase